MQNTETQPPAARCTFSGPNSAEQAEPHPTAHVPSQLSAGRRPASRNTCTTVPTENTCTAAVALSLATSHISNPVILLISCLNGSEEILNKLLVKLLQLTCTCWLAA